MTRLAAWCLSWLSDPPPHQSTVRDLLAQLPKYPGPTVKYATPDTAKVRLSKGWRLDYETWKRRNCA